MGEDLVVRRHFQAGGKKCGGAKRYSDPADTRRPSDSIEDLTKDCGTDQAAGEVTSEIDATSRAAVGGSRLAHEAGRGRLGEKRSNADEHHAQQDRGEIGEQKQRQSKYSQY
jgi:hypothetical protein